MLELWIAHNICTSHRVPVTVQVLVPYKTNRFLLFAMLCSASHSDTFTRIVYFTMSLQDVQNQIDMAATVSRKLESQKRLAGPSGKFSSKVRSGIRRELSAFRKVLEGSKSRLQELQDVQVTLDEMGEEPALMPKKRISPKKKPVAKSPHWLPSLARRKKFFHDDAKVSHTPMIFHRRGIEMV